VSRDDEFEEVVKGALTVIRHLYHAPDEHCCTWNAMAGWAPCDKCEHVGARDLPKMIVVRPKRSTPVARAPSRECEGDDPALNFYPVGFFLMTAWVVMLLWMFVSLVDC
jgi:hypothetical protein